MQTNSQRAGISSSKVCKPLGDWEAWRFACQTAEKVREGGLAEDQDHGHDKALQVMFNFL